MKYKYISYNDLKQKLGDYTASFDMKCYTISQEQLIERMADRLQFIQNQTGELILSDWEKVLEGDY